MKSISQLVEDIIADGVIDKDEYAELMVAFHDDGKIDAEEKELINKIYNLIKDGKVTISE